MAETVRVSMWSGPRNISTTMMYAFAQRADTEVIDEPLYAHYIRQVPDLDHPGTDEVLATMDDDAGRVIAKLCGDGGAPVRFYKNMGHHLTGLEEWSFLSRFANFILTRHPRDVIRSLAANMSAPLLRDLGYTFLTDLVTWLEARDIEPIVLVSADILGDPAGVLETLCTRLGIPWDPGMLSWPAGPRPEDGCWAEHWYANVHTSTGFRPYVPNTEPLDPRFAPLLAEAMPHYERLLPYALTAP